MRRMHSSPTRELTKTGESVPSLWDPFRSIRRFGLPEVFDDFFRGFPTMRMPQFETGWQPRVNIQETDKEYVISAALPGVKKDDVKISVQDGVLTLSGEYKAEKEEKDKNYLKREMSYGSFQRSFILPAGIHPENVKASHKEGILTVSLPKGVQAKKQGIDIKVD